MLKNDTLKNGTSRIGLYGGAPPPPPPGLTVLFTVIITEFKSVFCGLIKVCKAGNITFHPLENVAVPVCLERFGFLRSERSRICEWEKRSTESARGKCKRWEQKILPPS